MADIAISDTGPLRHLAEIGEHGVLAVFARIIIPQLVVRELQFQGFWVTLAAAMPRLLTVVPGPGVDSDLVLLSADDLDSADAAVLAVASDHPAHTVLTDDLALRRALKRRGHTVIGSLGIVARAHEAGMLDLTQADGVLDRLVDESTLYLTRGIVDDAKQAMRQDSPSA